MGPSGSGKSTLLHCLAGLDTLTSGHMYLGDIELSALSDKELTKVRRDRIGFVFQTYNLIPTLTAIENITLPIALAGETPTMNGSRLSSRRCACKTGSSTDRQSCRAASNSASQWHGRSQRGPPSSLPTSQPETSTRVRARRFSSSCATRCKNFHQTIVMVTHDPRAASYSERVVFLADGRIVDEMQDPTTDSVLDRMRQLGD